MRSWARSLLVGAALLSCASVARAGPVTIVGPDGQVPWGYDSAHAIFVQGGTGGGGGGGTSAVQYNASPRTATEGGTAAPSSDVNYDTLVAVRSGKYLPVDNQRINGAAIATGAGTSNASTPRFMPASDSTIGISGTLPAFAATPTFNFGNLNGAATAANQLASQGSATGGTSATSSTLGGLRYNATPPTLTDGQQVAQQADASGNTKVAVANPYATTTNNALKPPTAIGAKFIEAVCSVPAGSSFTLTTNCQIVGAAAGIYITAANWTNAILVEFQQPATGTVNVIGYSAAGATLSSAAAASKHLPAVNSARDTFAVAPNTPPTVISAAAQNLLVTVTLQ